MRYALYLAFAFDHPLQRRASAWLGRDADTGRARPRPTVPGLEDLDLDALTRAPRRYGFHGTLRAPFTPAADADADAVFRAAGALAQGRTPFAIRLKVDAPRNALGPFGALTLTGPSRALQALHEDALDALEAVRAPLTPRDALRYAAVDPLGAINVLRWGYASVRERFRFHMTLTGYLRDRRLRARVIAALTEHFADVLAQPLTVDSLALFAQPERDAPFTVAKRFSFTGSSAGARL